MSVYFDTAVFEDRREAGRQLASRLTAYRDENPIVLALPRGGVEIGYEVAKELGAPLDVIVARKLGAPGHPELGIGAVAPGGIRVIDEQAVRYLGITPGQIEEIAARETVEMERRLREYRGDRPLPDVRDRTVILVDDGLATGGTARAAIRAIKKMNPRRLVLAVPVCAPETVESLRSEVDDIICVLTPRYFAAVGAWYRDFSQLSDEQVIRMLDESRRWTDGGNRPAESEQSGEWTVQIPVGRVTLDGDLAIPRSARGVVLFAHGSGSSRHSARNRYVAETLQRAGFATLLMDLLTAEEERVDMITRELRFDIELLAERLIGAVDWLRQYPATRAFPIGTFGASTGAAAALISAAERADTVRAVVSRGGRADLAGAALLRVYAPTLLIVGEADLPVIPLNEQALQMVPNEESRLVIVPGATHLFEEPGALEQVARLAADWFSRYLVSADVALKG